MQQTPGQNTEELELAWDVVQKFLYTDLSYCKERQLIPFHCSYKELIIFIIVYFLLYCPKYFVLHIFFLESANDNYSLK